MSQSLVLVGPMGAGKSTIGKALSQSLSLPFIDIDQLIVDAAGADIPWIFDVEGEAGFRRRESVALEQALSLSPTIIATGGGIVTEPENRQRLHCVKAVVYLTASVDLQFKRTVKDKSRPLLQKKNPRQVLRDLINRRDPWYREIADMTIATDRQRPKDVVESIVNYWESLA